MEWIRVQTNLISHPKFRKLSLQGQGLLLNIWIVASEHGRDGEISPDYLDPDYLFPLVGVRPSDYPAATEQLSRIHEVGFLDKLDNGMYKPHDWSDYQYAPLSGSERTKLWRERKITPPVTTCDGPRHTPVTGTSHPVTANVTPCDGHVTPCDASVTDLKGLEGIRSEKKRSEGSGIVQDTKVVPRNENRGAGVSFAKNMYAEITEEERQRYSPDLDWVSPTVRHPEPAASVVAIWRRCYRGCPESRREPPTDWRDELVIMGRLLEAVPAHERRWIDEYIAGSKFWLPKVALPSELRKHWNSIVKQFAKENAKHGDPRYENVTRLEERVQ